MRCGVKLVQHKCAKSSPRPTCWWPSLGISSWNPAPSCQRFGFPRSSGSGVLKKRWVKNSGSNRGEISFMRHSGDQTDIRWRTARKCSNRSWIVDTVIQLTLGMHIVEQNYVIFECRQCLTCLNTHLSQRHYINQHNWQHRVATHISRDRPTSVALVHQVQLDLLEAVEVVGVRCAAVHARDLETPVRSADIDIGGNDDIKSWSFDVVC